MMKDRSVVFLTACGSALVAATVLLGSVSLAQDFPGHSTGVGSPLLNRSVGAMQAGATDANSRKLNALLKQLENAKSAEDKGQTKKLVREALVEYFDSDMKKRSAELDRLTQRSSRMSAALQKRVSAKEQLVDLQLKSFKYEADGLGLFSKKRVDSQLYGYPRPMRAYPSSPARRAIVGNTPGRQYAVAQMANNTNPLKTAMNRVSEARKRFQSAKAEEDRTKATTVLRKALGVYFDVDIEARQQEIDTIKEGLKKMEGGLQKRANAMADIVDLQLQIIANEAEGLGFFRTSRSGSTSTLGISPTGVMMVQPPHLPLGTTNPKSSR